MEQKIPVYGYGRWSKADKEEPKISLENQEKYQRRWCEKNNEKYDMYKFDKVTGETINRPSINEYKKMAEEGIKFKLIITRADRLGRGRAMLDLIEFFESKYVIEIISIANDIKGEMEQQIQSFISGFYLTLGRLNLRSMRKNKQLDNLPYTRPPFGYKFNKKKEWVVDKDKAEIVEQIYDMILKDSNWKVICEKFNLNPKQYYKIIKDKNYTGKVCHNHYIKNPLTREIYRTEEVEFDGKHEVIIQKDIFDKVQEKLKKKKEAKYLG